MTAVEAKRIVDKACALLNKNKGTNIYCVNVTPHLRHSDKCEEVR